LPVAKHTKSITKINQLTALNAKVFVMSTIIVANRIMVTGIQTWLIAVTQNIVQPNISRACWDITIGSIERPTSTAYTTQTSKSTFVFAFS
jgi:hypothetical protein